MEIFLYLDWLGLVCPVNYDNDDDYLIALVIEMIIPEVITPFYGGTRKKQPRPSAGDREKYKILS